MEYSDNAIVKIGKFSGECDIFYQEQDSRFVIIRKPSASGAGIAVGVMFGALGRAVMDSVATGEELAAFTARDIRQVETQEKRLKMVFTLYPANGDAPYTITIGKKKQLCAILRRELVERKAAAPMPAASAPAPAPAPYEPPVQTPAAPVAPVQPVAPIQPVAPVQYAQPQNVAVPPQKLARAWLSLRSGPMAGRVFDFAPGSRVVIGRDASRASLPLSRYSNVSGVHCCIEVGNGCLRVTDLNSTNGTFVNGVRLQPNQPAMLRTGDMLKLASDVCIFQIAFE